MTLSCCSSVRSTNRADCSRMRKDSSSRMTAKKKRSSSRSALSLRSDPSWSGPGSSAAGCTRSAGRPFAPAGGTRRAPIVSYPTPCVRPFCIRGQKCRGRSLGSSIRDGNGGQVNIALTNASGVRLAMHSQSSHRVRNRYSTCPTRNVSLMMALNWRWLESITNYLSFKEASFFG
jgi:hypothetical protein